MRRVALLAVAMLAACGRPFPTPPPAQVVPPVPAGTLSGQVVYTQPGTGELIPAVGATVTQATSSVGVVSGEDGRFVLPGIVQTSGEIVFRYSSVVGQAPDKERVVRLQDVGAGPGLQSSLGQVVVGDLSSVTGTVSLAIPDPNEAGGLGTAIYVPNSPFQPATTRADGSFVLSNLPAGPITIGIFHAGYQAGSFELTLSAGVTVSLEAVTLAVAPATSPTGTLTGTVTDLNTPIAGALTAGTTVTANPTRGAAIAGTVDGQGNFLISGVPVGLVSVTATEPGVGSTTIFNVLVQSGQPNVLPVIVVGSSMSFVDAGINPTVFLDAGVLVVDAGRPDAGPPDAGPPDAGPPDAGRPDAGPPDAGPPDAGPPDAGPPDSGPPDAGPPDSGGPDAGTADAGRPLPIACIVSDGGLLATATGAAATLSGSCSIDPEGGTLRYAWTQVATAGVPTVNLSPNDVALAVQTNFVAPTQPCGLQFNLVVTDSLGLSSAPAAATVNVLAPPTAVASPALAVLLGDAGIVLDGTRSSDPDHFRLTYDWTVAEGPLNIVALDGGTAVVTATGPALGDAGVYGVVDLVVSDGFIRSAPFPVALLQPQAMPPTVAISITPSSTVEAGQAVTLTGTYGSVNPHDTFTTHWTQTEGSPVTLTPVQLSGQSSQAIFVAPSVASGATVLSFALEVLTSEGKAATATATVIVESVPVTTPLQVIATSAVDGGQGSPFFATAYFSSNVNVATLYDGGFQVLSGSAPVPGTITFDVGLNAATYTFDVPLTGGASYAMALDGVEDTFGNGLAAPVKIFYTSRGVATTTYFQLSQPGDAGTTALSDGGAPAPFDGGVETSSVSTQPGIVHVPPGNIDGDDQVVIVGLEPGVLPCSTSGYEAVSFTVQPTGLAAIPDPMCGLPIEVFPRALRAGNQAWGMIRSGQQASLAALVDGRWAPASGNQSAYTTAPMITDGASIQTWGTGFDFRGVDTCSVATISLCGNTQPNNILPPILDTNAGSHVGGDGDTERFYLARVDGPYAALYNGGYEGGQAQDFSQYTRIFSATADDYVFSEVGRVSAIDGGDPFTDEVENLPASDGTNAAIGYPRLRVVAGLPPLLIQGEHLGSSWDVFAYEGVDAGPPPAPSTYADGGLVFVSPLNWVLMGGGAAGGSPVEDIDGVTVGRTLYVTFASGGSVNVMSVPVDAPATPWQPVVPAFTATPSCTADHPTIDSAPDGLWVAWSETCDGAHWTTVAAKLF